jgi:hypothetical protein
LLFLSKDLYLLEDSNFNVLYILQEEVSKMLYKLINSLAKD